jgi:pyridinium-3,5-biscarboxylic acid mononucleotide sulfurtransferase
MTTEIETRLAKLNAVLDRLAPVAVAVSGGVDSMTLATVAHHRLGPRASMYHAVSAAVPAEATERVRQRAAAEGWAVQIIDAGEFSDPRYVENPANRCFYCKTNLYSAIRPSPGATVVSGTNLDDLGDYRPGLAAAKNHGVQHPFVEAGIDKPMVRAIARTLGLGEIAELPAAPCLSSRVETGIRIEADTLGRIHAAERYLGRRLKPKTVRCRVRREYVEIELDSETLAAIAPGAQAELETALARMFGGAAQAPAIRFSAYRMGSAFLRELA